MYELGLGLDLDLKGPGLGLEGPGLGLESPGLGLEGPGLGLEGPGLVNIPAGWLVNPRLSNEHVWAMLVVDKFNTCCDALHSLFCSNYLKHGLKK